MFKFLLVRLQKHNDLISNVRSIIHHVTYLYLFRLVQIVTIVFLGYWLNLRQSVLFASIFASFLQSYFCFFVEIN